MYCGKFCIVLCLCIVVIVYCVMFLYYGRFCIVLCLCIMVGFVLCYIYVLWYAVYCIIFMYCGDCVLCHIYV
jgi:hypothetical protein